MESNQIFEILNFFKNNDTYKKIFINGPWGIGKSFYTNKFYEQNKKSIIYISLFGKTSINDIEDEINKEIIKKYDRIKSFTKNVFSKLKRTHGSITLPIGSFDIPEIGKKLLIEEYCLKNTDESIIMIFDDIERKSEKINIIDIMGMIENISLINNIKIVIIGDESNINEKELKIWNNFKEKIIEKEYVIDSFSNDAVESLIFNRTSGYLNSKQLESFINDFFSKHKIKNLRSINKSVNLFLEIIENYVEDKENKDNNLVILKNCLAVVIENTENLYEPSEEDKNSTDPMKKWTYDTYKDIKTRILSKYFNSEYMNNNDSNILTYIMDFYNCRINSNNLENFNKILNSPNQIKKDEKNIFYLNEKDIKNKVNKIIKSVKDGTYKFTTIQDFINDSYEIFNWNSALKIGYNDEEINSLLINFLNKNFYDVKKEEYQNKIDSFYVIKNENENIKKLIQEYNNNIEKKYIDDRLNLLLNDFKNNILNENNLEYFRQKLLQKDSQYLEDEYHKLSKSNHFFIPDLSKEIDDNTWGWTHFVWGIYRECINNKKYKEELQNYAKELLTKDNLTSYRINALLTYKPLF